MKKIISIVGPTASGKTELALKTAEKFLRAGKKVTIVSLDSRQAYREFPYLTVADWQEWEDLSNKYPRMLKIHNLLHKSIADDWSFGQLLNDSRLIVMAALKNDRQVILVGGTLICHQRLRQENELTRIPPNDNVRYAAENMSVVQLQEWLGRIDANLLKALSKSDQMNPRRLVRKIEIALYPRHFVSSSSQNDKIWQKVEQIFLKPAYDLKQVRQKIAQRVSERLKDKRVIDEVNSVIRRQPEILNEEKKMERMPHGFREIADWQKGKISEEECREKMILIEWQYVKRQQTFLNKLLNSLGDDADLVNEGKVLAD